MIVTAGESLVDIVRSPDGAREEAVGGSPMNVAVGLARLGVPALLLTQLGDDDRGRRVAEHVRASGADLRVSPLARTSTATAHLDGEGHATYEFDLEWSLPHHDLPDADVFHLGSLGAFLEPGCASVRALLLEAAERDLVTSFDPNIRPQFVDDLDAAWESLVRLADASSLVKVSDEDLATLRPGVPLDELAATLLAGRRTTLVVVTAGSGGATGHADGVRVEVASPPTTVVDTVGAGDSFMAAALAVTHRLGGVPSDESGVRRLLTAANAAAAVTVSRRGANPPTRAELSAGWGG